MRRNWLIPALAGTTALWSAGAMAQNAAPTQPPTVVTNPLGEHATTVPHTPVFTGPLAPAGKGLYESGISVRAAYSNLFLANGNGGIDPGVTSNLGTLTLGTDLDLQKMMGIRGGSFHFTQSIFMFKVNNGRDPNYPLQTGSYGAVGPFGKRVQSTYLSVLAYEQKAIQNRLDIEIGRLNPTNSFDPPNSDSLITNQNPIAQYTANEPPPPYATWGGWAKFNINPTLYLKAGGFEDHFSESQTTNGYDFSTAGATGGLFMGMIGTDQTFNQTAYPGSYNFTGFFDSSKYTNPALSTDTHKGTEGFIFKGAQTIWRSDDGTASIYPAHHLTVFTTDSYTPDAFQPYNFFSEVGMNYYGWLPNRPMDRIGFKVTYIHVGADELLHQENARVAAGGPHEQTSPNEMRFEVSTLFHLKKGILFQPTIMYVLNPDTHFAPNNAKVPKSGFTFGLTLIVPLSSMLGLSSPLAN